MKTFAFIAAALVAPVLAAPAPRPIPINKRAGPVKEDSYIIKLKDGVSVDSHLAQFTGSSDGQNTEVVYKYDDVFNGYAGVIKGPMLDSIRSSPDVEFIQADTIYNINWEEGDESLASREIHNQKLPNLAERGANGEGVDIYGLDTGILTTHTCFGGRARWGATFGQGYKDSDGNGHGTHTAGTAAGTGFGLATAAKVIAVKVCSDAGQCAGSDIVAGIEYVVKQAGSSGRPSIATMSLGGEGDAAIDAATSAAITRGIHFTVAAGNDNHDASGDSPARVAAANTIGAVDISNRKASFSNFGCKSVVDVWALGVNVLSAWNTSNSATNTISGTSMATPHVAGIVAVVLGNRGQMKPAELSAALVKNAKPLVIGAPSGTTNLLAQVW
ncbi:peptidase S8 family protein [Rhizoctonia solani 123E]|uniref:Peptidase S8 family protein n=1 Tax=Rhizoctonia solani 123E TaxID=1423351 RepID=A0A074RVZ2_9AGAM|nr:peptidase S8 family protein [Rhizoctonia solani 123E]